MQLNLPKNLYCTSLILPSHTGGAQEATGLLASQMEQISAEFMLHSFPQRDAGPSPTDLSGFYNS